MDSTHDDIVDLLHRSKKLREAGERLIEEATKLASKADQLIRSYEAHEDGKQSGSVGNSPTEPA